MMSRVLVDKIKSYASLIITLLAFGVAALVFYILAHNGVLTEMVDALKEMPIASSALIFFLLFLSSSFPFGVGNMPYNIAAGYVYESTLIGGGITLICISISSSIAFVVSRSLCKGCIIKQVEKSPTVAAVIRVIEGKGSFVLLMMIRILPLPFGMLNGAMAVSKIKLLEFVTSTALGCSPMIFLNAFMGTRVKDLQTTMEGENDGDEDTVMVTRITIGVQVVMSALLVAFVVWRVKKVLKDRQRELDMESSGGENGGEDIELQPLTFGVGVDVSSADDDDDGGARDVMIESNTSLNHVTSHTSLNHATDGDVLYSHEV